MKNFALFLLSLFLPIMIFGQDTDRHALIKNALSYFDSDEFLVVKENAAYCIVQRKGHEGYVIVSLRSDRKGKVIGYSNIGEWKVDMMPPALMALLDNYEHLEMPSFEKEKLAMKEEKETERKQDILPLLTCHWHQNSPYNDLSPVIVDGNIKTVAGCVAIAAAQITYYWRRDNPEATLKDTPVYPYGVAPVTMSISHGSPNSWELMRDSYTEEDSKESRYAVAQLCYVIGTTSYLNYASSTGGQIYDAAGAIYNQYNLLSDYVAKNSMSQEEWENLLYQELQQSRPVMCSGQGRGGHAFVLDGYDSQLNLYHFNFGWGGIGDGYYLVDDSEEAMGGYYQSQAVVYNIHPMNRNIQATMSCQYENNVITKIKVNITLVNNSTLPLRKLNLYAETTSNSLKEFNEPVWCSTETVSNDNTEYVVSFDLDNLSVDEDMTFYLTDENKNILTQYILKSETNIIPLLSAKRSVIEDCYSIVGEKRNDIRTSGIYIIRYNDGRVGKLATSSLAK